MWEAKCGRAAWQSALSSKQPVWTMTTGDSIQAADSSIPTFPQHLNPTCTHTHTNPDSIPLIQHTHTHKHPSRTRSAHEVLRGDTKLLAPEETPEEVLREREARAAQLAAVQDRFKSQAGAAADGKGESCLLSCIFLVGLTVRQQLAAVVQDKLKSSGAAAADSKCEFEIMCQSVSE